MKQWTLTALYQQMINDLNQCHTDNERSCCRATCSREIRELAVEIQHARKLNPGEVSVLLNI